MLALLAGLAITACGGGANASADPGSTGPGASSGALSGAKIVNDKFSSVVPQGWENTLGNPAEVQKLSADGKLLYLVEQGPPGQSPQPNVNDVRANINVVLLTQPVPDDQVSTYLTSVSRNGASHLSATQAFAIRADSGLYITYDRDIQGTPGESRDMIINHGGATFHIVLNTSHFAFAQQLPALQALLTAWKWSS
ncbi:MAG: hypothetical protein JF887_04920 [Candidatus Dormibacteraeota bacterium]|uniref:PsbP C-terminal domain-containing protein n=1 Tax=Candidatus Amunia macphersoniae TaxID=3127014 RepID=A0A934KC93_9BACT|nr:hypothetical protein [Candidatus Dormibacteraeota bacterium]